MSLAQRENRTVKSKLALFYWIIVISFVILISGFWRLQIFQSDYYSNLAERNHLKDLPIAAPRGRVLDRYNRVLVDNYPAFAITAQWEFLKALQEHIPAIAEGLQLDPEELARQVEISRKRLPYRPFVIRENATREDIAFVESHRIEFPELDLVSAQRRLYPPDGLAANMLGYVGEVSDSDLDRPELALTEPGDHVGKTGLERQYDDVLRGEDGVRRVIVNSRGADMGVLDEKPPTAGHPLRLTIDLDLQEVAEQSFQGDNGALVALDPRTGEVLAMVSRPAYDPNLFAKGISREDWAALMSDPHNPLLNRAIQAQLAPGSIYKIILAAAALEAGTADAKTVYSCPGGATFYGRYFKCWEKHGHGQVNMHQAIVHSCDVFFYNVGKALGIDRMAEYSTAFGLGHRTGIDLPNEETGVMPSEEWKERVFHQKWYAGETISLAIGQGALTVTPLQLAYSIGGITSGGYFARPHLISWKDLTALGRPTPNPSEIRFPLQDETVTLITNAMYGVVNEGGTGGRARIVGVDVAGKTGSAQVASVQTAKNAKGSKDSLKDNAWFVGLAPRRNPEIVVCVLYEGGEHGYLAAPIARAVIKAYFDKKNGIQPRYAEKPEKPEAPKPEAARELAAVRVKGESHKPPA